MGFKFNVQLEDPSLKSAADWKEISEGELTVVVAGGEPIVLPTTKAFQEVQPALVEDPRFAGLPKFTSVHLAFRYLDDDGIWGAPVEADFVLSDMTPPVTPDTIGINVTEVPDPE